MELKEIARLLKSARGESKFWENGGYNIFPRIFDVDAFFDGSINYGL